jgi:hypothetical protein
LNLKNEKEKKLFKSNLETIMQYFCIFSKYNYNGRNIYRKNIFIGFILFQFGKNIFFILYNMSFNFSICINLKNYIFFKNKYIFLFLKKNKIIKIENNNNYIKKIKFKYIF